MTWTGSSPERVDQAENVMSLSFFVRRPSADVVIFGGSFALVGDAWRVPVEFRGDVEVATAVAAVLGSIGPWLVPVYCLTGWMLLPAGVAEEVHFGEEEQQPIVISNTIMSRGSRRVDSRPRTYSFENWFSFLEKFGMCM